MNSPPLVCPACRRVEAGALRMQPLTTRDDGLLGCACGARYPVVDGIPVVFRALDAYLAQEAPALLRRHDLPPAVDALITRHASDPIARDAATVATYAASREGPLQAFLREVCAPLGPRVLEIGAGLGVSGRSDVVALDCAFAPLRRNPSGTRVCADAGDPPFGPASFDAVVLANVLDACADPGLVLAQADALLAPGGTLVITCAFAFQPPVTPRARWFDAEALDAALHDGAPLGGWAIAPYAPVRAEHRIAWPLQLSPRTTHAHRVDVRVCRKRA